MYTRSCPVTSEYLTVTHIKFHWTNEEFLCTDLPSAFNGVMVVVEVGASARNTGQSKPHSKKFALYKNAPFVPGKNVYAWVNKKKRNRKQHMRTKLKPLSVLF